MELIRTETVEGWWASWWCCWLCEHYRWLMDNQSPTLSLCCGSWDKQWYQEPLSPSFFCHLQNLTYLEEVMLLKEYLRVLPLLLFHGKRIAVATTDNGTNNMIKVNERWRNRKIALCCLLTCWTGSWGQCEVQSNTSKKKWKKERDQEDQWLPRDKVLGCIYMCTPRHLREEVGQAVWYERRKQKRLLL